MEIAKRVTINLEVVPDLDEVVVEEHTWNSADETWDTEKKFVWSLAYCPVGAQALHRYLQERLEERLKMHFYGDTGDTPITEYDWIPYWLQHVEYGEELAELLNETLVRWQLWDKAYTHD